MNLEETIKAIKTYVGNLNPPKDLASKPPRTKHSIAKDCIERITASNYSFTDEKSHVSTLELLALLYIAIHDQERCSAKLEYAQELFVEGLYQIQREYNIQKDQDPNEGEDQPMCVGGTFNKLMERLWGIHEDVDLRYITQEYAAAKFPKLAKTHALEYLKTRTKPNSADEYREIEKLLESIKSDGYAPIWSHIREKVKEALWGEFAKAYGENIKNPKFLELLDAFQDLPAPDLSQIEADLTKSEGYCLSSEQKPETKLFP